MVTDGKNEDAVSLRPHDDMTCQPTQLSTVCHGNIARSQVLHHYLVDHARRVGLAVDVFSCGTASVDTYPNADRLLAEVQSELDRRGLNATVVRCVLDDEDSQRRLVASDWILVADAVRRRDIIDRLGDRIQSGKVVLFYEFIGEGVKDFVDTYDAVKGAQDPERFARCFDELERIARLAVERLRGFSGSPV